jgi:AcrR family transcriptional regulator
MPNLSRTERVDISRGSQQGGDVVVMDARVDRRVIRTRRKLHKALMSLIHTKDYDAITVEDICATAGVGRSTFYAHYSGKDELKRKGLEQLCKRLLEQQRASSTGQVKIPRFSLAMFQHARDHIDHYQALSSTSGRDLALGAIRQILSDLFCDELAAEGVNPDKDAPREVVVEYVVGAYMAVLIQWLESGAKLPPERIDAAFRRLTTEGLTLSGHQV